MTLHYEESFEKHVERATTAMRRCAELLRSAAQSAPSAPHQNLDSPLLIEEAFPPLEPFPPLETKLPSRFIDVGTDPPPQAMTLLKLQSHIEEVADLRYFRLENDLKRVEEKLELMKKEFFQVTKTIDEAFEMFKRNTKNKKKKKRNARSKHPKKRNEAFFVPLPIFDETTTDYEETKSRH
eukprot:g6312.t1